MSTSRKDLIAQAAECAERADELAEKFRRLFRESQEAYGEGDGELAKELSVEGHEAQDECKELNQEAKDLRQQATEVSDNLPLIALRGIPPIYQNAIFDALDSLPAEHISGELIDRISYSNKYIILDSNKGIPQQAKAMFPINEKPYIVVNRQTPTSKFISIKDIRNAIAHEVGHVVYKEVLTRRQIRNWRDVLNEIYAPLDDREADLAANEEEFARVYSAYYLDDEKLTEYFSEEVSYVENLEV